MPCCNKDGCQRIVMMRGWRCHSHREIQKFPAEAFARFSDPIVIETRKEERARKRNAVKGGEHALREAVNEGMEKFGRGFFMIDAEARAAPFKIEDERDVMAFVSCASSHISWEARK